MKITRPQAELLVGVIEPTIARKDIVSDLVRSLDDTTAAQLLIDYQEYEETGTLLQGGVLRACLNQLREGTGMRTGNDHWAKELALQLYRRFAYHTFLWTTGKAHLI